MRTWHTEVIIIGSGLAGLLAALELSSVRKVTLVTKSLLGAGNSIKAQGGIAAALTRADSIDQHLKDTLQAGHYFNDKEAAVSILEKAPEVMHKLFALGIPFDKNRKGEYDLAQEGAHSERRIYHAGGDSTGAHIIEKLKEHIADRVEVVEAFTVYDLVMDEGQCKGIIGKDKKGQTSMITAQSTIVASGGCGQVYDITSNAEESTGDGLAMAYRAGAKLMDMEFMQFHPTMLVSNDKQACLLSEAIRGEGGRLVDEKDQPIMERRHPLGDLAPRSITARVVWEYIKSGRKVFLSIKHVDNFHKRFPTIAAHVQGERGILMNDRIPVHPGAHFLMGGISVNKWGETNIENLYAIGEVACTGLHGANRLASNSLLEASASALMLSQCIKAKAIHNNWKLPEAPMIFQEEKDLPDLAELKVKMSQWAGIIKTKKDLLKMRSWLTRFHSECRGPLSLSLTKEALAARNCLDTAWMIVNAALVREESRGAHIRTDYPEESQYWSDSTVCWEGSMRIEESRTTKRGEPNEYVFT
ncbi:L-aspartate oxidase [Halobacillus massiliensis]|uniref:L-aspartate oxidase n=1 Tax=Halobacillus massiliensis TaxID=1926286 RepID=UPI0015C4D011|nr:L-aspartate oxidase [Halobacillus massiliensis]